MRKNVLSTIVSILLLSALTGCGAFESKIPALTDEQQDLVVEYATEVLLHYDRLNGDKIRPVKYSVVTDDGNALSEEDYENKLKDDMEAASGLTLPENEIPETTDTSDVVVTDNTEVNEAEVSSFASIADCFGLTGVSIEPAGYEITDFYPQSPSEYFVMNATEGNRLIILRFKLTNTSGSDIHVDVPYGDVRYKITLNDNTKNALTTLLVNDMGTYSRDLLSGESEEVVLVGEFDSSEADNINSLSLVIKRESGDYLVVFK